MQDSWGPFNQSMANLQNALMYRDQSQRQQAQQAIENQRQEQLMDMREGEYDQSQQLNALNIQKQKAMSEKMEREEASQRLAFLHRISAGVKDQGTLDAARDIVAQQFGPDALEGIPEVYNEEAKEYLDNNNAVLAKLQQNELGKDLFYVEHEDDPGNKVPVYVDKGSNVDIDRMKQDGFRFVSPPTSQTSADRVQSSEKLPDGTVLLVNSNKDVEVRNAANEILTGQEAIDAIRKGREYGSELANRINYNRETGKLQGQLDLKPDVESETARAKKEAGSSEERIQGVINKGMTAAESIPKINRSLSLLDEVETGGYAAAALKAKQTFGIESGSEAELVYNLKTEVLSKMRPLLGAQFTEYENKMLQKIEAGTIKSTEGNKRILNQALKVAKRNSNRAIKRAEARDDFETADEIRDMMDFSLDPNNQGPETEQAAGAQSTAQRTVVRTGTDKATGRKVVQYSDGSVEYAK
jgi:hypothetical protein